MSEYPKKLMILGSGELGKEIVIAAKRLGCYVIACDRYKNAPAMQVADKSEILNMKNQDELKKIIKNNKPDIIIPEIEALAVETLIEIEQEGIQVIPNAIATATTMNRDKIRDLASLELNLETANFRYASNNKELIEKSEELKWPVLVKPVMSSSGKGQSLVKNKKDLNNAWEYAMKGARGKSTKVIIEEFIEFDLDITLLTIRQKDGPTLFCPPIGHEQLGGDYQRSWQPAYLNVEQLEKAQSMASIITERLGGIGLFGVEFFISGNNIIFSELSPRPHDTGLVTIISQNLNEFELHIRAILGLPIPHIKNIAPSASSVILSNKNLSNVHYLGIEKAISEKETELLLFGKPNATKGRRMGVSLAKGKDIDEALQKANKSSSCIKIF